MPSEVFDRLFARGREAVLSDAISTDTPPTPGDPRWGLSIVLRPNEPLRTQLNIATEQVVPLAGDHQWATGSSESSHLTVRSLEPHRAPIDASDPSLHRYAAALRQAARAVGPIDVEVAGLTLSPRSVMARVIATGSRLDDFSRTLQEALGPDGWYERDAGVERDAWYMNLIHFTDSVSHPQELIEWINGRRHHHVGAATIEQAHLVRWTFDGGKMLPHSLRSSHLRKTN